MHGCGCCWQRSTHGKGDLAGNLVQHVELLERARSQGWPDWHPRVLVVDVPVEVVVRPGRPAARALVVDDAGRTLLVRFASEQAGTTWLCPPGGGPDAGEDHLDAVRRELREEFGATASSSVRGSGNGPIRSTSNSAG